MPPEGQRVVLDSAFANIQGRCRAQKRRIISDSIDGVREIRNGPLHSRRRFRAGQRLEQIVIVNHSDISGER